MNLIYTVFGYPLGLIMWGIYLLVKNYGVSIIIFTLLSRIALFPLAIKSQKTSAKTQLLSPKLEKIKQKYPNDKTKQQEETMKLYEEEGFNPMGGCGPALIQLPIFLGIMEVVRRPLYYICRIPNDIIVKAKEVASGILTAGGDKLPSNFEFMHEIKILNILKDNPAAFSSIGEEYVGKINDFNMHFMGIDFGATPTFKPEGGWTGVAVILVVVPILTGLLQILGQVLAQRNMKKTNPSAPNMGSMNVLMYGMSLFYIYITLQYPFGLAFYFCLSALLAIVQTLVMGKIYTPEKMAEIVEKEKKTRKNNGKKTLMQRLQEQAQAAQAQMEEQQGGSGKIQTTATEIKYDEDGEIKITKSQQKSIEKQLINEARRRMAEKYGDEYNDDDT